jgi:hypothetical protein
MSDLGTLLASLPDPTLDRRPEIDRAIAHSVEYLASDAAQRSLDADTYWPKWDSPWWHLLLLHELGEARRIPERAVAKMVEGLNALRVKIFPIRPEEVPSDTDPHRDLSCHCAIGSIYQVLAACGVDVDAALPWIRPWPLRYQMTDGGLNCDSDAYLQSGECASSMVGTVPLFEAMLERRERTLGEERFVERASGFLIERKLTEGSRSVWNAAERDAAPSWLEPCFPRFYFYDVLRGLAALARWAEAGARSIPRQAVSGAIEHLVTAFPDGVVRPRRRAWAGKMTLAPRDGKWAREPASTFPLLEVTSTLGEPSEALTRQWSATRRALLRVIDDGKLTPM